jgi:hypothetical protein
VPLLAEFFADDERGARATVSSTARAE